MSAQSILAHRKMALDTNVWFVLLITMLFCLGLISYKLIDNKSCTPFVISVKSLTNDGDNLYEPGETLIFKTSLPEAKELLWQFGDGSDKEQSVSVNTRHKFSKPGVYTVTATLNGSCSNEIRVNVKKSANSLIVPENTNLKTPKIYGSLSPIAGRPERYISDAIGNAYEWQILDKASFPAITEQYAVFSFPKPGLYILQLTVDHDRKKRSQIEINVVEDLAKAKGAKHENIPVLIPMDIRPPKSDDKQPEKQAEKQPEKQPEVKQPDPADVPKRKIINIRNEIFQSKLEGVVTGQNDVHDFDNYLPDGGDTKVLANGEKNYKTFKQLCDDIRGKKKIVIESVELIRTDDNQIQQIKVKYKKKGLGVLGL